MVIVRGPLAGIEATVLRPTRFGFYRIQLDSSAPRWAAIRRASAAAWALAPADHPTTSDATLARRRRIAHIDLAVALILLPLLLRVWNIVPALAVVLGTATVAGLAALHSTDRVVRRVRPAAD